MRRAKLARWRSVLAVGCGLAVAAAAASAEEGKWTPEQVLTLDRAWLEGLGLKIAPTELWSASGAGLLAATVQVSGCTASFVSPQGLVVTNYHCAFGIIQQHSTPARDLIAGGFVAADGAGELPGKTDRAKVPFRTRDVTAEVLAAVPAGADDLARFLALERRGKELVAECEQTPNRRCEVAVFDGGVRYVIYESIEYPDVRLVYAPPSGVGEFGGEVDNWSWPRHTGDFSLLRVYAAADGSPAPYSPSNVPLRPGRWLPFAKMGVRPDDFVMITGYPGRTVRSWSAAEMALRAERHLPRVSTLYSEWIRLLEAESARNPAAAIALAGRIKSLANVEKNARGQLAGLARGRILERKRTSEAAVVAFARSRPELAPAAGAYAELGGLLDDVAATWERDFLLSQLERGAKPLSLALVLVRAAGERAKPDMTRQPEYMERVRDRVARALERADTESWPAAEVALCTDTLSRFAALPAGQRSAAADGFLAGAQGTDAIRSKCAALLGGSKVGDAAERGRMFEETPERLRARRDPLLDLAFAFDSELRDQLDRSHRFDGAVSRLRPVWLRAVAAQAGRPQSPDANATLRVSFGHVRGYSPRDGVWMKPQTTLGGMVEKHTGAEPFAAPPAVLAAASSAPASRWADAELKDVPVAFLADLDTTGGNSGSPILNGKGEIVGVNFDRPWENVANDFGYNPDVARNISVDVRYLLWMLDAEPGAAARWVLDELGVGRASP